MDVFKVFLREAILDHLITRPPKITKWLINGCAEIISGVILRCWGRKVFYERSQ